MSYPRCYDRGEKLQNCKIEKQKTAMNNEMKNNDLGSPSGDPMSASWAALTASSLELPHLQPWPEPVDGKFLLDEVVLEFNRFLLLPKWGAETLALCTRHTYAFQFRTLSTYQGIQSPVKH